MAGWVAALMWLDMDAYGRMMDGRMVVDMEMDLCTNMFGGYEYGHGHGHWCHQ